MRNEQTCVKPPVLPWPAASPRPTGSWGTDTHATGITAYAPWGTKSRRGCGIARTWVSAATSVHHRHPHGHHAPTSPSRVAYSFPEEREREKAERCRSRSNFTYTKFYKVNLRAIKYWSTSLSWFSATVYLEKQPQIQTGSGLNRHVCDDDVISLYLIKYHLWRRVGEWSYTSTHF